MTILTRRFLVVATLAFSFGCEDLGKKSAELSREQVHFLAGEAKSDVLEVRGGLPVGSKLLVSLIKDANPEIPSFEKAHVALERAREKTDGLRYAKSTFFAVAMPDGRIIRRDGKSDAMAGKALFEFYPGLREALTKDYVESSGTMPEASGVRAKPDEQWVAASPVRDEEKVIGLYVTGWSWSSYAYRLEVALRSKLLGAAKVGDKVPLIYIYVLVKDRAFGAPISPALNGKKLVELKVLEKTKPGEIYSQPVEIDGRVFGLSAERVAELGADVAIVVLRSET